MIEPQGYRRESRLTRMIQKAMRPKQTFEDIVYEALGDEWCGNTVPPLDHKTLHIDGDVVSFCNDGFEVWLGTPNEWKIHFDRTDFLKISAWVFFQWAFFDCFGLRRKAWYWALGKRVKRWQKLSTPTAKKEGV